MKYARLGLCLSFAVIAAVVAVLSQPVAAGGHGGGVDGLGCHHNNKVGNYHCHQGTCAGRVFDSKAEAVRAGCQR